MKDAGIQSIVSMLSDSELATYAEPLPAAMEAAFGQGNYVNVDAKAAGEGSVQLKGLDLSVHQDCHHDRTSPALCSLQYVPARVQRASG